MEQIVEGVLLRVHFQKDPLLVRVILQGEGHFVHRLG